MSTDFGIATEVVVDSTSYAFNPEGGGSITVSGGPDNGVFDANSQVLDVITELGSFLEVNFTEGTYSYRSNSDADIENIHFTFNTSDGDLVGGEFHITADAFQLVEGSMAEDLLVSTFMDESFIWQAGENLMAGEINLDTDVEVEVDNAILAADGVTEFSLESDDDKLGDGFGSDVLAYTLADESTPSGSPLEVIADFDASSVIDGGDSLDLRDLLHVEQTEDLVDYLHFEQQGTDTVVHISTAGKFVDDFDPANADQTIVLESIDLTNGGSMPDMQIIQDMLAKGNLLTD